MVENLLFHEVSEKEKEEIKKEAKQIMDGFAKKLSKIDAKMTDSVIERDECERKEGNGKCSEMDKEIMFENSPEKRGDFIVAEKGEWA